MAAGEAVRRLRIATWWALVAAGSGCSCRGPGTRYVVTEPPHPSTEAPMFVRDDARGDTVVEARFSRVRFHVWPGVALQLDQLRGRMQSRRADRVVSFDDNRSFTLAIDTGIVALSVDDLGRLMNTYVFAYRGAPLYDLSFAVKDGHLVQRGVMHKGVEIPFEMIAEVSATPEGKIRVHPIGMKICSLPGMRLMRALGITLEGMLDVRQAKGVRVEKNDLILDPEHLLPPPAIAGRVVAVSLEPGRMVQHFGGARRAPRLEPDTATANYMLFRGGTLQFGKLFMVHADMQVVDLEPRDAFDFDITRYREQIVAGYHRTLPSQGLLVFMPDLTKLRPNPRLEQTATGEVEERKRP